MINNGIIVFFQVKLVSVINVCKLLQFIVARFHKVEKIIKYAI